GIIAAFSPLVTPSQQAVRTHVACPATFPCCFPPPWRAHTRIVKIFELAFLLEVTPPTIAALQLVFRPPRHGYSLAIGTVTTTGERRWIGNTCSRLSREPSIRNCCCATNIW